jgi:hypothetical protein
MTGALFFQAVIAWVLLRRDRRKSSM